MIRVEDVTMKYFLYTAMLLFANALSTDAACGQLAGKSKPADELLMDYLLAAEELSSSHCSSFEGVVSVQYKNGRKPPFAKAIHGISAVKGLEARYHC
ncbi:MAG: hypothetical protein Aurels2KO_34590 [Aureliella sp.]